MEITEQQHKAAGDIIELIAAELGENRAIHPGTAITACARLSGSFLFRSFWLPIKDISPGNVVLSEQANEKGQALLQILSWTLSNLEVNLDSNQIDTALKADSNLGFLDSQALLQNKAATIMDRHKLNYEQMAYSCAMATAFLIKECQHDLLVESGFNTAIYGFIEGTKTYPPELAEPNKKKKNFFTFWK